MKNIISIFCVLIALSACGHKTQKQEQTIITEQVVKLELNETAIIYFHSNHRCATCLAVEKAARDAAKACDDVNFYLVDVASEINKELMETYKVSTQSLLVVKGAQQKNVTSSAFMYARSKPEKVVSDITVALSQL